MDFSIILPSVGTAAARRWDSRAGPVRAAAGGRSSGKTAPHPTAPGFAPRTPRRTLQETLARPPAAPPPARLFRAAPAPRPAVDRNAGAAQRIRQRAQALRLVAACKSHRQQHRAVGLVLQRRLHAQARLGARFAARQRAGRHAAQRRQRRVRRLRRQRGVAPRRAVPVHAFGEQRERPARQRQPARGLFGLRAEGAPHPGGKRARLIESYARPRAPSTSARPITPMPMRRVARVMRLHRPSGYPAASSALSSRCTAIDTVSHKSASSSAGRSPARGARPG